MWKYLSPLLWSANVFWIAAQTVGEVTSPSLGDANPIPLIYGWADIVSKFTDRALWLLFLGLILWLAWFLDKRKEKHIHKLQMELEELREGEREQIKTQTSQLQKNNDLLNSVSGIMSRVERTLEREHR